jgi:lysozyme
MTKRKKNRTLEYAARFVAPFEGEVLHAYPDSGGVWTIGYGHTDGVKAGQTCTHAQALRWLEADLRDAARAVDKYVTRRMSMRQRIAWISFTFNCGSGALAESTALARFNAGDRKGAAQALQWWNKDANGIVLAGLQRRRRAEAWLLTHPFRKNPHNPTPSKSKGHAKGR